MDAKILFLSIHPSVRLPTKEKECDAFFLYPCLSPQRLKLPTSARIPTPERDDLSVARLAWGYLGHFGSARARIAGAAALSLHQTLRARWWPLRSSIRLIVLILDRRRCAKRGRQHLLQGSGRHVFWLVGHSCVHRLDHAENEV